MKSTERRKFKRLVIALGLSCRKVGSTAEKSHKGCTLNVSPGGLYFETAADAFKPGNILKVELSIPPTAGLLEFGGRISSYGRVLRTCNIYDSRTDSNLRSERFGIALEFCRSPKLCT